MENATAALEILRALKPRQAATYCAADGTVEAWRKIYNRRADGTIRGFASQEQSTGNGLAGGQWEPYRLNVAEAASRAQARAEKKAAARASVAADIAACEARKAEKSAKAAKDLEAARSALETVLAGDFPAIVADALRAQIADLEGSI